MIRRTTGFKEDVVEGYIDRDLANVIVFIIFGGASGSFPDEPMLDCISDYFDEEVGTRVLRELAAGGSGGDGFAGLAEPYSEAVSNC